MRNMENNMLQELNQNNDDPASFFSKVLFAFKETNFYNVLVL